MIEKAKKLYEFANTLQTGHLKGWKSTSMISTIEQITGIVSDDERLLKYVRNCLEMEGFTAPDCKKIAAFIKNELTA